MLDSNLIVNFIFAILIYKSIGSLLEFTCIKILSKLLDRKITGRTRAERVNRAIRLADEELKKTELN